MKPARSLMLAVPLVALGALNAWAVCDQSSVSTPDLALWNVHGCNSAYFLWEAGAYDIRSGDWGNRGYYDACNPNLEYAKHWNGAYLISYGLPSSSTNRTQWHGTTDYETAARAGSNVYHSANYHTATDDLSIYGRWVWQLFGANRVETSCLLYNASSANANPASRGGDYLHEAWHSWLWHNGYYPDHYAGPVGNCTMSGNGCDYFYFHPVGQYPYGSLYFQNGTSTWFHSPNQVQVEYLCDVATSAASWVPLSVRVAAAADANHRASQRFINGPGLTCSAPTPIIQIILFLGTF